MENSREIISLQFGHYANHVGAHFWNIQELSFDYTGTKKSEINHDILYREGVTLDNKPTYTPRLLLADLKGSLKTLPEYGGLEPVQHNLENYVDWPCVDKQEDAPIEQNDYLKYINSSSDGGAAAFKEDFDFNSNVETWTDYLYSRFHKRSIHVVNEFKHADDEVPFENYQVGCNIWKSSQFNETFTDDIRHFSEECDNMQGFNITLDAADAFGGLATSCTQHLGEEYPNKAVLAFPLIPSYFKDNFPADQKQCDTSNLKDSIRLVNLVFTLESLFEYSSMFTPMCCGEKGWRKPGDKRQFYNVNYDSKSHYQSSAIVASFLDTISLKYRHRSNHSHISDICADLTGYGRKMSAASLGLPFYMKQNEYLIEHLDKIEDPLWNSLTPYCTIGKEKLFQHIVVRGLPEDRLKKPLRSAGKQIEMQAYRCDTVQEMLEFYFQCKFYASPTNVTTLKEPLEIKMPFPEFFSRNLNRDGLVKEFEDDQVAKRVPVLAGLHNGSFLFEVLESLLREAKRVKLAKINYFKNEGLEQDDFEECLSKIAEIQNNYEDSYEL